jgi:small subunit ribosomal protein S2
MKNSIDIKKINELFDAEVHLGHKKNRVHPNAKKFIYKIESGVSIIDLTMTLNQINKVKEYLTKSAKENKTILVVATKKAASQTISSFCSKLELPYITIKWPPGLLTNFDTIIKNVEKLKELKKTKESGEWDKLPKHERVFQNKNIKKLEKFYGGIINLEKKPDILIVFDIKKEENAINEAEKTGVSIIGIIDTNSDPEKVDYPIIANDDSPRAIEFLIKEIFDGVKIKKRAHDRLY